VWKREGEGGREGGARKGERERCARWIKHKYLSCLKCHGVRHISNSNTYPTCVRYSSLGVQLINK